MVCSLAPRQSRVVERSLPRTALVSLWC